MNIAIVGAGFYGCYLARAIERQCGPDARVVVYERDSAPMMRAATNNQSRLHLGFHYPRSPATIRQTVQGWRDFTEEFRSCLHYPTQNLYAVHRHGLTPFLEYLTAMDAFGLSYDVCGTEVSQYFRNFADMEGVIRVGEGVIDLEALDALILSDMRASIRAMLVMAAPFGDDVGLTVVDGGFVSLYPCGRGRATLSSVTHTPFVSCETQVDLENCYAQAAELARQLGVAEKLLAHGESVFMLDRASIRARGMRIAPKTKLRDDADGTRISDVRNDARLISVLCGKLDAVHATAGKVIGLMTCGGPQQ